MGFNDGFEARDIWASSVGFLCTGKIIFERLYHLSLCKSGAITLLQGYHVFYPTYISIRKFLLQLAAFVDEALPVRFVKHPGKPTRRADVAGAGAAGIPEGLGGMRADTGFYHPEKRNDRPESRRSPSSATNTSDAKVCLTPGCVKAAARMLDNMDEEVMSRCYIRSAKEMSMLSEK